MIIIEHDENVKIYPVGERGVTLASTLPVSLVVQQKIWWLAAQFRQRNNMLDIVPGMNNLTLLFDTMKHDISVLMQDMLALWKQATSIDIAASEEKREITIPVNYGGQYGPDLEEVAKHCCLSVEDVIEKHSNTVYTVFFIGFQPGFAYLGGLDPQLVTPRRAEPRLEVPSGSVGIGGAQTGIYPKASPGGWQLIGNSDVELFDPYRAQPSLLLPGDQLRFTVNKVYS